MTEERRGRPTALFDVDGTLLDTRKTRYLVATRPKDFAAFYGATPELPPNYEVVKAARQQYEMKMQVVISTGRELRYAAVTLARLNELRVPWVDAFLRQDGDRRKAVDVKRAHLESMRAQGYDPFVAWDDDRRVIEMYGNEGLDTVLVPGWDDPIELPDGTFTLEGATR